MCIEVAAVLHWYGNLPFFCDSMKMSIWGVLLKMWHSCPKILMIFFLTAFLNFTIFYLKVTYFIIKLICVKQAKKDRKIISYILILDLASIYKTLFQQNPSIDNFEGDSRVKNLRLHKCFLEKMLTLLDMENREFMKHVS